ncbi:MAG: hypothetical protein EZS28_032332 [Streblomastix strix]|uniref:Uncharacterized protein n=1 Tax=Streblomastix strix TaxID=222440 RepID=A0A5J4UNU3_9EUKA|nr:MAG: hypothetical protein EZS28_032332 [Streblomastix strix]
MSPNYQRLDYLVKAARNTSVGQSSWTIVQLDELSGTAREGPRPVKCKTEIEITHQQKAKDSFSNINNSTELDYTQPELELKLNFEC